MQHFDNAFVQGIHDLKISKNDRLLTSIFLTFLSLRLICPVP
nr:MAG TPA: hypothetical protein [Caudoviricetes sp.]